MADTSADTSRTRNGNSPHSRPSRTVTKPERNGHAPNGRPSRPADEHHRKEQRERQQRQRRNVRVARHLLSTSSGRRPRRTRGSQAIPVLTGDHHTLVKAEFFIGFALIALSPWVMQQTIAAQKGQPITENARMWVKRIIAWTILYMVLLPMSRAPRVGGIAAGLGGLMLMAMFLMPGNQGIPYAEQFFNMITTLVTSKTGGSAPPAPPPPPPGAGPAPAPGAPGGSITGPPIGFV